MTDPTTPAAVDPQQERGGDDALAEVRAYLDARAICEKHGSDSQISAEQGGDGTWCELTTDALDAVLAELEQRRDESGTVRLMERNEQLRDELERLRAERDWQPGRWRQVRRPDGTLWMETSDGDEAEAEARKQGWPLYRLWEYRETEWRLMVDDTTPQQPEPTGDAT